MATTQLWTIADLERRQVEDELDYELIRGELLPVSPAGGLHGWVSFEFGRRIGNHVADNDLGRVYSSDTGFIIEIDPDTLLQPDIPFVRADRLPPEEDQVGFMPVIPDLVVEVKSPTDRPGLVARKIDLYLDAGVPLVWYLDPEKRVVRVHAAGQSALELTEDDTLDGGEVLPGFRLSARKIFR